MADLQTHKGFVNLVGFGYLVFDGRCTEVRRQRIVDQVVETEHFPESERTILPR